MRKSVTAEDIICGYVIPADIKYKLSSEEDAKGCITSYILPASSLQPAINELVYAELIRLYGYYLMDNYMSTSDIFPKGDYTSEAFKYYENIWQVMKQSILYTKNTEQAENRIRY